MKNYLVMVLLIMLPCVAHAMPATQCTLIVDNATDAFYKKDGDCDKRYSPESTFKIALALMGFDSGILSDPHNPIWNYEDGFTVNQDSDRQPTQPVTWLKNSVVWYSQKLTKTMGMSRFSDYVHRFGYGNNDLSGDPKKDNGLTHAWLDSSLAISPIEQVEFMRKILNHQLNISPAAYGQTEEALPVFYTKNGWRVVGKTGTGDSVGWFVGWAARENHEIVFAKMIFDEKKSDTPLGTRAKDQLMSEMETTMK